MRRVSWQSMLRASAAEEKRRQRQERVHLRALERSAKEQAKLSALEQARLEVATHEGELAVLLSVHKDQGEPWDWAAIEASLPPVEPRRQRHRELRARQHEILAAAGLDFFGQVGYSGAAADGRLQDDRELRDALEAHAESMMEWEETRALAHRIRGGDCAAFTEALAELDPFADAADLCAGIHFTVHNRRLVECALRVKGTEIIPTEAKTLTATGKLSVKAMPKKRFHEIYQDYVCACALRVSREAYAILPIEVVLVTASVEMPDPSSGIRTTLPVLSVAIPRSILNGLDWDSIDPSDAIGSFVHRGDVKASRKTGEFVAIVPLTPGDVPQGIIAPTALTETVAQARQLSDALTAQIVVLAPESPSTLSAMEALT